METLRRLRKTKGLTQTQLADAVGLGRQAYAYYEKGEREPSLETLGKLADFFGVSVDELLGRSPKLFDDARVERPEVLELFDKLTSHQQALILERMRAYADLNEESIGQQPVFRDVNYIKHSENWGDV